MFVPADLEEQKILATGVYGTNLVAVRSNYDDVNRLCTELSAEHPWAFVNVNLRPYYSQGSKTIGFEVAEQLGFELPDRVVCPVASGSLFTQIAKGFEEWIELGLIEGSLPTFNGAQASGCSPLLTRSRKATRSAGLCARTRSQNRSRSGTRADGVFALDLARRTGGSIDAVSDEEIIGGISSSPRRPGSSPRRPVALPRRSWKKLADRGDIGPEERVVLVITGEGLKTLDAVRGIVETCRG